jgi:hypothetical protein
MKYKHLKFSESDAFGGFVRNNPYLYNFSSIFRAKKDLIDDTLSGLAGLLSLRNSSLLVMQQKHHPMPMEKAREQLEGRGGRVLATNFSIAEQSFQLFASRIFELQVERKHQVSDREKGEQEAMGREKMEFKAGICLRLIEIGKWGSMKLIFTSNFMFNNFWD